jgi:hypothetical protein
VPAGVKGKFTVVPEVKIAPFQVKLEKTSFVID